MAKKKKVPAETEIEDVPEGKMDDDGDEIIDLYDEEDNLSKNYKLSHKSSKRSSCFAQRKT